MKLKPKTIRRFVVLLAIIAPVVYLFGALFASLRGSIEYMQDPFAYFFGQSNFLSDFGNNVLNDSWGFSPVNQFFAFMDGILDIGSQPVGLMAYGYCAWVVYVLILDMCVAVVAWVLTLPQRVLDMFERNSDV